MDEAVHLDMQEREKVVESLTRMLVSGSPELKTRACFLLGEYRAFRAVPDLIENLALETSLDDGEKIPLWGYYPCQEALSKIGRPAERALIAVLASSDDPRRRDGAFETLRSLKGNESLLAQLQRAEETATADEIKRLQQSVEQLKKYVGTPVDRLEAARTIAEMDDLTNAAVEQQIQFTSVLAGILRSSASADLKARACFLLGFYREGRAINELISNIALEVDVADEQSKIRKWGRFPCAEALGYIGQSAQRKLMRVLTSSEEKIARQQALGALTFIHRKDIVEFLQSSLEGLQDEEARRLQEAIVETKKQRGLKP
jgi:HEAT repeat protein